MSIDNRLSIQQDNASLADCGWDNAIADAETRLAAIRRERLRLKRAICVFREKKQAGDQWPGRAEKERPGTLMDSEPL